MSEDPSEFDTRTGNTAGDFDSTSQLISRARAGDQEAIERLFARHLKPLQRWASGRLPKWARDLTDTDDLVQEAMLQTFKKIGEFEPQRVGALLAYLRQAVLNRLRDELRRKARRPDAMGLDGLEDVTARSPLEEAIGRQGLEEYEEALGRLRPEEREVIIARVEIGYTWAELAEALGKPSAEADAKRLVGRYCDSLRR